MLLSRLVGSPYARPDTFDLYQEERDRLVRVAKGLNGDPRPYRVPDRQQERAAPKDRPRTQLQCLPRPK
jgi:hypothetical protein